VHGPMGIHAQEDPSGEWRWAVQDALGSVRGEVDADLAMRAMRDYVSYGDPFGEQGTFASQFGFTGEPYGENGLLHLRARYYHADVGRFFQMDPSRRERNLYGYVGGNPVNFTDPSGLHGVGSSCSFGGARFCGPDITQWFIQEIEIHASWIDLLKSQIRFASQLFDPTDRILAEIHLTITAFRDYAKAIPYKWMDFAVVQGCSTCDNERTITFCGECIDRSELGNIMFGFSGARLGIDQNVLWWGGRMAQGLSTTVEEAGLGIGIELQDKYGDSFADMSSESFCNAVKSLSGSFVSTSTVGIDWILQSWLDPNSVLTVGETEIVVAGRDISGPHTWTWNWQNFTSDYADSGCQACTASPSEFPHTVPGTGRLLLSLSSTPADGYSPYANRPDKCDPFYTYQLCDEGSLAPEIFRALGQSKKECRLLLP
jgi:RHS repeat-associated protein